jgi:hypothetical protein
MMNTLYYQSEYEGSFLSTLEKSKKEFSLSFIIIETIPFAFLLRPFLFYKLSKVHKQIMSDLDIMYESIPQLSNDKLELLRAYLEKLLLSIANMEAVTGKDEFVPKKIKTLCEHIRNKAEVVLEMVEINLNTDLITELNDAIGEIKS